MSDVLDDSAQHQIIALGRLVWSLRRIEHITGVVRRETANTCLIVLLGGKAGLRCGEMMALVWSDVDLGKRQLRICQSEWKEHVTSTKDGRVRGSRSRDEQ